jgi:heme-degrading monooxygenase HmoA
MMFIAMNRFRVKKGSEQAFEQVWLSRDTQLTKVPGFVEFHLLKGSEHEDYTLYSSHTVWQSKATFEAWTRSEAFRLAHRALARTSRSTSTIRSSKASRSARRCVAAKMRSRRAAVGHSYRSWRRHDLGIELRAPETIAVMVDRGLGVS